MEGYARPLSVHPNVNYSVDDRIIVHSVCGGSILERKLISRHFVFSFCVFSLHCVRGQLPAKVLAKLVAYITNRTKVLRKPSLLCASWQLRAQLKNRGGKTSQVQAKQGARKRQKGLPADNPSSRLCVPKLVCQTNYLEHCCTYQGWRLASHSHFLPLALGAQH